MAVDTDQGIIQDQAARLKHERTDVLIEALRKRGYVVLAERSYAALLEAEEENLALTTRLEEVEEPRG